LAIEEREPNSQFSILNCLKGVQACSWISHFTGAKSLVPDVVSREKKKSAPCAARQGLLLLMISGSLNNQLRVEI
jgi:hypothetical protein